MELQNIIESVVCEGVIKLTASKPASGVTYRKITVTETDKGYFIEQFTEKQAFHKNITKDGFGEYLTDIATDFLQFNIWTADTEHIVLVSKKGKVSYKRKRTETAVIKKEHNRKKQYLIEEVRLYLRLLIWVYLRLRARLYARCTINSVR